MSKLQQLIAGGAIPALRKPEAAGDGTVKYYFPVLVEDDKEMIAVLKDDAEGMYFFIPPFISSGEIEMKACLTTNLQTPFAHFCIHAGNPEMVGVEAYLKPPFSSDGELCLAAIRSAVALCYELQVTLLGSQLMGAASQTHSERMMNIALEEIARLRAEIEKRVAQPEGI